MMSFSALGSVLMLLQPVSVDFVLEVPAPLPMAAAQAPNPVEPALQDRPADPDPVRPVIGPRLILAQGFGDDVPLDFAVKQIVPPSLRVEYGATVDRQLRVSWKGGKPWQQVLRSLVDPIGLRLVLAGRVVRIVE
jgi:hypothetical protein